MEPAVSAEPFGIKPPGFRLPPETRLGRVRLQVSDVERSLDYYRNVLGLRVLRRDGRDAVLGAHGGDRALIELHQRAGARPVPRSGRLGLYHFAILLPDRAALGRFLTHLASIGAPAGMADHFVSESVYLYDPDGLGIEVYADRPRAAWRVDGRELYITTEPLDVESVVRTAAGERWTGMPAGTVMGHVHLSVGDLDKAAAFYHAGVGFDKTVWTYPGALFLSAGGYHHHLGTNTWAAGAPRAEDTDARLLHWELVVPRVLDAEAAGRSVALAGYAVTHAGGAQLAIDPWGTTLRVVAREAVSD